MKLAVSVAALLSFSATLVPKCALADEPQPAAAAAAPATTTPGGKPLPEVPEVADEPLPEWKPPVQAPKAVFLDLAPQARRYQALRQWGLGFSSVGFTAMLAGGIVYSQAVSANRDLGISRSGPVDPVTGVPTSTSQFSPALEDQKNRLQWAGISLLIIGGVFGGGGLIAFGVGQAELKKWHREHPVDVMPALTGF